MATYHPKYLTTKNILLTEKYARVSLLVKINKRTGWMYSFSMRFYVNVDCKKRERQISFCHDLNPILMET